MKKKIGNEILEVDDLLSAALFSEFLNIENVSFMLNAIQLNLHFDGAHW